MKPLDELRRMVEDTRLDGMNEYVLQVIDRFETLHPEMVRELDEATACEAMRGTIEHQTNIVNRTQADLTFVQEQWSRDRAALEYAISWLASLEPGPGTQSEKKEVYRQKLYDFSKDRK